MRLPLLACLLSLTTAYAAADSSSAEGCGECKEQIQALTEKSNTLPQGDARLPELLLRLGKLHQEASEFYKSPSYRDTSSSGLERFTYVREAYRKAEEQYTKLIEEYPRFQSRDEALSLLLQLYLTNTQTQKALKAYERLSQEHPKSRFLPATHFAVAEHLFVRSKGQPEKLEKARKAYKKAAGFPGSPVHFQALFMQGWCSFYLNDLKDTQAAWMAAVLSQRATARRKPASDENRKRTDQLLLDYVKVFARAGDVRKARGDFSKLTSGPDERIALMMLLDLIYRESGGGQERQAAVTLAELEKDCKAGKARACNAVGLLYMEGAGLEADKPRAAQLFEKACRSKLAAGCHNFCNPEVVKVEAASNESRAAQLREKVCDDALSPVFGEEAEAQAFWEPLERVDRRSPSALSRLLGDTNGTPLSELMKGFDDRHRERMALYPEEESEMNPPAPAPKYSVDVGIVTSVPMPDVTSQGSWKPVSSKAREEIRSVIFSHREEVRECFGEALMRKPSLEGMMVVKFVVTTDGSVVGSEIEQSTLQDTTLESCIVKRVSTWRFPRPVGGGLVLVHYPFFFKPDPGPVPN